MTTSTQRHLALAAACLLAACASERTQVIVVTDTNMRGPGGLDEISVVVMAPDGRPMQSSVAHLGVGQPELPRTLGLVWTGGPLGPFTVQVEGRTAGHTRITRTGRFNFQQGRSLILRMDLLAICEGTTCAASMTCGESGCRAVDVPPSELAPYTGTIAGLDAATRSDAGDAGADAGNDAGDAGSIDVGVMDVGVMDVGMPDGGIDGGNDAGNDGGNDAGHDSGPIGCTADAQCTALDGACQRGTCTVATGLCTATPRADGTACDDGLFCTSVDTCTAGACGGPARNCSAMTNACNTGTCDEAADACVRAPVSNGTVCDDGLFCTTGDLCTAGTCSGAARDCSAMTNMCNTGVCDETGNACVRMPLANGTACDDGLFCTLSDMCSTGACVGAARPCADANACTADSCDEGANVCVNNPAPLNGMVCDDGLFCTTGEVCGAGACGGGVARVCDDGLFCNGSETCDEAANVCAPGVAPCNDAYTCTVDACVELGRTCTATRSEPACAAAQICNPVAYPAGPSGCGAVPTTLTVNCPASGTAGVASMCTATLAAGAAGVPGEASRITCAATPGPVQLFVDHFTGGLDPAWMASAGVPRTDTTLTSEAATATANWQADVSLRVAGLSTTCVDFRVAQAGANTGERIRWDVAFDGGAFATVFDLNFNNWRVGTQTYLFNRNVCVAVPGGATTVQWNLRMDSNGQAIWVDDVAVSGVGAPFTIPTNGGPDDFTVETGWTFVGGPTPHVGLNGGSSAMFAEQATYTATRGVIDATTCDVLDTDFDFGYQPGAAALDANDDLRLEVAIGGGAFSLVEFVDFNTGVGWNLNNALLPWLGLRRITDRFPAAVGASSVVFRFRVSADDIGERTWVDNFVVRCADLPTPPVSVVTDAGAGSYSFGVRSAVPVTARVTCTWMTTNDGPLTGSAIIPLLP